MGNAVDTAEPRERRGLSRRDMIKGAAVAGAAAWTAPVIIDSLTSPAAAGSLPPCVPQFTASSADWVVDNSRYLNCNTYSNHYDLQLTFTVGSCADTVKVTVTPLQNKATWCFNNGSWNSWTPVTHTFNPSQSTLTWVTPTANSTEGGCTHVAHSNNAVDDGIHVNPCATNQVQYSYTIGNQAAVTKCVNVSPTGVVTVGNC